MAKYFGGMTPGDGWIADLARYLKENNLPAQVAVKKEGNMPNEQFIIGTLDSSDNLSLAPKPAKHPNIASATTEAQRLARQLGKRTVILKVVNVVEAVVYKTTSQLP